MQLTCEANLNPMGNFSWYFNETLMNPEDNFEYKIEKINYENNDTQISTLNIFNATSINSGKYKCIINNLIGFAYREIILSYKSKKKSWK